MIKSTIFISATDSFCDNLLSVLDKKATLEIKNTSMQLN